MTINLLSSLKPLGPTATHKYCDGRRGSGQCLFFISYINALDHRRISKVSVRCAARLRHRLQWWEGSGSGSRGGVGSRTKLKPLNQAYANLEALCTRV